MNYIKRLFFALGMIIRNIIKLIFGLMGMAFHFVFATITYLLVIFGWYNNIDGKKLIWSEFNPISPILFFSKFFHINNNNN